MSPRSPTLRVLHFIDNLGPGGKERQLVELAKGCGEVGGYELLVVSMTQGLFYSDLREVDGVRIKWLIRRWKKDPLVFASLLRIVREFRPDVLVAWDHMTAVYAIPAVKLSRVRFINAMIQDAPTELSPKAVWRGRLTLPMADVVVANSHAGLRAYGVPPGKGCVIYNGFDPGRFETPADPAVVRRDYGIPEGIVVGMVATFRDTKDQPTLLKAARDILRIRRDVVFLFVGDGENLASCKALAEDLPVGNVRFLGSVDRGLESLVNLLDIGVLATYTEGISNSIMEYMIMGKAVVATDGGGTNELVKEGDTGFLVPPRDPVALARRIGTLLDDAALRKQMGERGRERVRQVFGMRRMVDEFRHVCTCEIA